MAGKDGKGASSLGRVVQLSPGYVEVRADGCGFKVLDNIKLEMLGNGGGHKSGEIYAKVLSISGDKAVLRFTSVPGEGKQFIRELLA
jgi:hypothetical protein